MLATGAFVSDGDGSGNTGGKLDLFPFAVTRLADAKLLLLLFFFGNIKHRRKSLVNRSK